MELDFDKEIDALLRKSRDDRGVLIGDSPKMHLDADELAAFAENMLPEKTKQFYMVHIAECNSCRKTLSSLIRLNAEAEPAAASPVAAPGIIATSIPWYRNLFLFPNIAYVMGSLVLLFGGFFVFSVLQNSTSSLISDVSQIADSETQASGPNLGHGDSDFTTSPNQAASTANATNSAANRMTNTANTMANAAPLISNTNSAPIVTGRTSDMAAEKALADRDKNATLDGVDSMAGQPASQPAPAPKVVRANDEKDDLALAAKKKDQPTEKEESFKRSERKVMAELPRSDARGPAKSSGPSRDMQSQFPNRAENSLEITPTRSVSGKKFQRKDGVWYDTAYRGQGTTNISRGASEYRKLDSGLRVIAESLDGVVVTVWKDKAYRIQ